MPRRDPEQGDLRADHPQKLPDLSSCRWCSRPSGWAYFRFATNPTGPLATATDVPLAPSTWRRAIWRALPRRRPRSPSRPGAQPNAGARGPDSGGADLTGKESGIYNIPGSWIAPDLSVQSLSPASVTLTVVPLIAHTSAITLHYVGNAPASIVAERPRFSPRCLAARAERRVG